MKKCYCYGSEKHMLNSCEIRYRIARYQRFDRTVNVHSHHQQAAYKGDEQIVEINADVSVSSTKAAGAYYKSVFMGANK